MADRFLKKTYKIIESTDPSEYIALSNANKDLYKIIISAGVVDINEDSLVRNILWGMFSEGTTTREGLDTLLPEPVEEEE